DGTRRTGGGSTYTFLSAYDADGRLLWSQDPDGEQIGSASLPLTYDGAGRLYTMSGIITRLLYDAGGQLLEQTNANGTVTTQTFSSTRGFLTRIRTAVGKTAYQ